MTQSARDTFTKSITAQEIYDNNGIIDYTIDVPVAYVNDPNHAVIMEVEAGVLLTDLQNNPVVSIKKKNLLGR